MGRRRYPPELRRRAVKLVRSGQPVREVARLLGVSTQSIYLWRRQDAIDRGDLAGLSSAERSELAAARRRIAALEAELAIYRRAAQLSRLSMRPRGASTPSR